jgi:hypothetical protein
MNLSMLDAPDIDWRAIADGLSPAARNAGCRCDYERNSAGIPMWFPVEGGGIARKLIRRCSKCIAVDVYDAAVQR